MPKKNLTPPVQTANNIILEETALELGLPQHLVREVVRAQSEFTAMKIKEGGLEGVMWPRLGKIKLKVSRLNAIVTKYGNVDVDKNTISNDKAV